MEITAHIPSLTHLREHANARARGRRGHVQRDRAQVLAPKEGRIFSFVYEKFISATIAYVEAGCRGGAFARAIDEASDRMRPSYTACAKGMTQIFAIMRPVAARRRQRNVVISSGGVELVSLRLHLVITDEHHRDYAAYVHFPGAPLSDVEFNLVETSVALACAAHEPKAAPLLLLPRTGAIHTIDVAEATRPERVATLKDASLAYRAEWLNPSE
ncbi:hypothetical protein [Agrococcus jejuensis]|uniref:Uncharacterized protein n=1 Tax=Agrococcus jejuensis TaxID=399736 RepID=A0A1G8CGV3_9MICO|nr:hypothetical protein [Agrococcus jejuensis]SDH44130.1 hypothetical protein SAMN04489720_1271 [Agrococcus jejuensis]